ncbi:right-handed parallel beta-helix repeat-containing protein [Archangium violaceum]|uniref:right-handed parallel beta-helix repeat-containing protein n=1 Tax=Archangium violaceum TaxID=83451 RepID=UPI0019504566|nr:right-handed parallel beta-helix repeat-containing protein [Archangium violaceum]QRN97168.1 right-handed parallel beta-helix repeat-containing protein [Archangium violaceum]
MNRADVKRLWLLVGGLALVAAGCREERDLPVTYTFEPPPSIQEVSQTPTSVGPADLLRLSITVAGGSRGALSFSWTTNAGVLGTPVDGTSRSEVVWTSPSCLPADVKPKVTVMVTDTQKRSASHTFEISWTGPVCTQAQCPFSLGAERLALEADCTTDSPLFVPDGYTFDGQGHTVTAVNPSGGRFTGAVIRNKGGTARVRGVSVTASGLTDPCESGAARLRGILLEGATGEVVDSEVRDLNRGLDTSGCQEGFGIEVRNDDASRGSLKVDVLRNRVSGYQKLGILVTGAVEVNLEGNTVDGRGPVAHIARNGIQVSNGARGRVTGNTVSGNAYTGPAVNTTSAGILVAGGSAYGQSLVTGLVIEGNTLTDNDVGISLSQYEGEAFEPPAEKTLIRVAGNDVRHGGAVLNPYYQAAISDSGTGNIITANLFSGAGYTRDESRHLYDIDVSPTKSASRLVFLTSAQDFAMGACSGKVTVQSQDENGNLVRPADPDAFTVAASGVAASGVTFYTDAGCTESLTTLNLSNPQAEASFFIRSSQPGAATVEVSGGGLSTASQAATIR